MRSGELVRAFVRASVLVATLTAPACAKTPPEAQAAPAASASSQAQPAAAAQQDTTLPPGIDASKLDDFQKKVFFRIINNEPSVCGQAQSLIASAKKDCRRSYNAIRYVGKLVEQGFTDSEVSEAIGKRYRNTEVKKIDVSEAPMKGSPGAKVTLVEFADYECPHCKRLQPVLRQIVDEFHNDVKVYFKHYPLPQHTNARMAAEAAVAANKQGKFWSFQDKIWDHQDELSPAVIEKIAKDSGLDVAKFRQDMASDAVKGRVQKDRDEGQALGLQATPTVYIDGREYTDPKDAESFREWIKEELAR
jgi:protein-disulfide isomerase